EVIETVKRVSNVDFAVRYAPPRPGDPAVIIADAGRIRAEFGWKPEWDDLDTIVTHALTWERQLIAADGRTEDGLRRHRRS
ncbi:MAG TPA: hypothetical protein VHG27_10060, partial [Xanthobacteraceae bacterium]|nr:hypothetical protein [Xanthobacteraceae bacterium]